MLSVEFYVEDCLIFETEIIKHLRDDGDKEELGYAYIRHLVDDFECPGPNETYVCLLFEFRGETLGTFGVWFKDNQLPYFLISSLQLDLPPKNFLPGRRPNLVPRTISTSINSQSQDALLPTGWSSSSLKMLKPRCLLGSKNLIGPCLLSDSPSTSSKSSPGSRLMPRFCSIWWR